MTLAQKYVSYLDIKQRLKADEAKKEQETPVLLLIENEGLDLSRKIELLDEYIASLQTDLEVATKKREELVGSA